MSMSARLVIVVACASPALGQVAAIGPFVGEYSDTLNTPGTTIDPSFDLFGGRARLRSYDDVTTTIHYLFRDQLDEDLVTPRTGSHILGFTTGPAYFHFADPVSRFGAWWENNSGGDDALVEFFDVGGNLIDAATADTKAASQTWTWNGWESDAGISTIRVTGNGIIEGFLWFDDFQMTTVPTPGAAGALVVLAGMGTRRRRR